MNPTPKPRLLFVLAAALVCACADSPASPAAAPAATPVEWVTVARSLGLKQCDGQPAQARADLLATGLRGAGVEVGALRCAHDGRMRPQVCGASDGRLMVVDVPAAQLQSARGQGFEPLLTRWPDALSSPCR